MNQKIRVITLVSMVIPFLVAIVFYIVLPPRIAAHLNADGMVTRYGSKAEIFIMPFTAAALQILYFYFWRIVHPYSLESPRGNVSKITMERILLISSIVVASVFASIAILSNYHVYAVTTNKAYPPLLTALVGCAFLSTVAAATKGARGWILAIPSLVLLAFGLLNLFNLGLLTTLTAFIATLSLYAL